MQLSERTLPEISETIVYMDARERLRKSVWLAHVAEFDRRDGARRRGFRSTAEWLAFECKMERRTAQDHVRVSRRLEQWTKVADAFAEGRLSYCQVRALCRADESANQAALLKMALVSTVRQIETHVRQLRCADCADVNVANRGRARRYVRTFWDEHGCLAFHGRLPADDGAAFQEAVNARAEMLNGQAGDPCCSAGFSRPPIGARRADALVELVTGGAIKTTLVLHADPQALACAARGNQPRAGKILHLQDGPAIPSELARRLTCDAMVTIDGLNLGRSTPIVSQALKRALTARDGRVCSVPGCERTHGLEAHHIDPWQHGGRTDLVNLRFVCRHHHHNLHEGGWRMRRRRDGTIVIKDPNGREIHELPSRASPALAAAA